MNVYDFDDTIYEGDSTRDFIFYILRNEPIVWLSLPKQAFYGIMFLTGKMKKTEYKQNLFSIFTKIKDIDLLLQKFSEKNSSKIKKWYLNQKKENDLIISASPYFLVESFCTKIGIKEVIASNVDLYTGKYTGENCYGEEKVIRFNELYKNITIDEFYSDSYSDEPLAKLAKSAYLVHGNEIKPWAFERNKL